MSGVTAPALEPRSTLLEHVQRTEPLLLLLRASLLVLLVNSNDDPWVFLGVAVTCVVVLPRPKVMRSPWLWASAFAIIGLRQLSTWHTIDDHIVATTYWCGALALGLTAPDPTRTLRASARLLVGTLFAFAAVWKLRSGEFLDGTFFRYSLLFDDRFEVIGRVVGGTTSAVREANIEDVGRVIDGSAAGPAALREGPRNELLAQALTWWGVVIESAVAVAFVLPLRERFGWIRHATLIAFAATTYAVVPIGGFATLLLVLGAAIATDDRLRLGYYAAGVALWAWTVLWPVIFL